MVKEGYVLASEGYYIYGGVARSHTEDTFFKDHLKGRIHHKRSFTHHSCHSHGGGRPWYIRLLKFSTLSIMFSVVESQFST